MKKILVMMLSLIAVFTAILSLSACEKGSDKGDNASTTETGKASEGLKFELNYDSNVFSVVGIGNCMDKNVIIPSTYNGLSVTSIANSAFSGLKSLTSIVIPDSVTSIGDETFFDCGGLTNVTIGNNVTSIGEYSFVYCGSLTSVTIPSNVTNIGKFAFGYCGGLTSVTFENTNGWKISIYSDMYNATAITSYYLSNSSTAATYLKNTYDNFYWERG